MDNMEYEPNNWVLVYFPEHGHYKILGGWSGGYLYGDSWRINSGVKATEDKGEYLLFHGYSGSTYKCHKNCEMLRMNISGVAKQLDGAGAVIVKYKEEINGY